MTNDPYSETDAIMQLGRLDYQRFKQANQRCLDAGGCEECYCVFEAQHRHHWGHCSQFTTKDKQAETLEEVAAT